MSNLSLERLLFDPTNVADGPIVGSYIVSASDSVIDSTDVGGTEGLNVNVLNGLTIDADGIYNVSTNPTPDNIGLIGFTRAATPGLTEQVEPITVGVPADDVVNANVHAMDVNSFLMGFDGTTWDRLTLTDGDLNVNLTNTSIAVTASDLDIRDLTQTDEITAYQGGTWTVGISADADDAASTYNPINVGGVAYDQSTALGALSATADRGHMLMDLYRRIFINDAPNRAVASVNKGLTDAAAALVATELAGRMRVLIQNVGSEECEIGPSGVTWGAGIKISKGGTLALEAGEAVALYGICNTSKTTNVRVFELA